jgi:hypothetical protein
MVDCDEDIPARFAREVRSLSPSPRQPTGEDPRERVVSALRTLVYCHDSEGWKDHEPTWDEARAALRSLSPAGDTTKEAKP